jgi:hypothetical protein
VTKQLVIAAMKAPIECSAKCLKYLSQALQLGNMWQRLGCLACRRHPDLRSQHQTSEGLLLTCTLLTLKAKPLPSQLSNMKGFVHTYTVLKLKAKALSNSDAHQLQQALLCKELHRQ